MAIDAYVGKPGHGKSYGVVEHVIIPSLKQGRVVVTNIPLQVERLMKEFGGVIQQLEPGWDKDPEFADKIQHGAVLVLDEIWRRWPSGLAVNKAIEADKVLFMEHRHRVDDLNNSMRIVLVTQDLAQVASWVRLLVEQTFRVVKRVNVGMTNRYRVDIYDGPVTGDRPPKNKFLRSLGGKYRKEIYQYYSSATQSQTGSVGDESKADGRGNALKSTSLVLCFIFIAVMLVVAIRGGLLFFSPILEAQEEQPAKEPAKPAQPVKVVPKTYTEAVATVVSPQDNGPVASFYWRVAGHIQRGDQTATDRAWSSQIGYGGEPISQPVKLKDTGYVVLISVNGKTRYLPESECSLYADGINYTCDVDNERVTPWTGQGAVTATIPSSVGNSGQRAGGARDERSEERAPTTAAHVPPDDRSSVAVAASRYRNNVTTHRAPSQEQP